MTPRFLDTSYVIALEAADDRNHEAALQHWRNLVPSPASLVTTSYVLTEIVTFFNCRNRHPKAVEIGTRLLQSPSIQLLHVDEDLFYEGWRFLKQHTDKSFSLTDCISFVVMERFSIRTGLAFDRHFQQAGFERLP